jgi:hypothetical protein
MADVVQKFTVTVDGLGEFVFARRNMRRNIAIGVETSRLNEGVDVGEFLEVFIAATATLKCLTVSAPDGWDIDEMDPFEADSYSKVMSAWSALRDKEESFRKGAEAPSAGNGKAAS